MQPIDIFIAYSHKDLAFKDELRVHLRPLVRAGRARVWDDYDIEAGREWDAAIKERLYGAQIILLLVSPDSLDSDYFYGKEVTVSLERHARGEAVVVPVILRACLWHETPLGALEALPTKGRPVASWPARDDAWHATAQEVSELVNARRAELEQLTALDNQRRDFAAAVAAAEQLFQHQNWPEARRALTDALARHQPGFAPDAAVLREKIARCDEALREAGEQQRREHETRQRRDEDDRRRAAALAAQQEADRRAAEAAERQRRKDEQRQAAEAEKQRRRETAATSASRLPLLGALALGAVLVLALLVWRPGKKAGQNGPARENTVQHEPAGPAATPAGSAENADFNAAKTSGKMKALEQFLAKYPGSPHKSEVAALLIPIYLRQARTVVAEDPAAACSYLQKALALDPAHAEALKLKRQHNCQ